ncbi:MAG TPA: hypothetical protein VFY87_14975 [Geminicoccaceae bacterium]|nr:hypothetical protein [Geminicoccaceae bacterium]
MRGFSIDAVVASAHEMAARAAAQAPDLTVTFHDPREALRAVFGRRTDRRAFDIPEPLASVVAASYAASLDGTDSLHPASELTFALDTLRSEPAGGSVPVLPPSRAAAEWANDHELGHFVDRAASGRAAWFERYDFGIKHLREIVADGFAHVLSVLRFDEEGSHHAAARADWRAHNLIAFGDAAHFTSYAATPFLALARALQDRGETAGTIDPATLVRLCRALAVRAALPPGELDELQVQAGRLRRGEHDLGSTSPRVAAILVGAGGRFVRHRVAVADEATDARGWFEAIAAASPANLDLLRAARAMARLDHATTALGPLLASGVTARDPAGTAARDAVVTFLGAMHDVLACPLAPASGPAELARRVSTLEEGRLRPRRAAQDGATLMALLEALVLAWEGIEQGLLPGYLDRAIRNHGWVLMTLGVPAHHAAPPARIPA